MSNLSFYEKAIALRNQYEGSDDSYSIKYDILCKLISVAFTYHEKFPRKFELTFPSNYQLNIHLVRDVAEVLEDLGYEKIDVSKNNFYNMSTTTIFIKLS